MCSQSDIMQCSNLYFAASWYKSSNETRIDWKLGFPKDSIEFCLELRRNVIWHLVDCFCFSVQWRRLWVDLITIYKIMRGIVGAVIQCLLFTVGYLTLQGLDFWYLKWLPDIVVEAGSVTHLRSICSDNWMSKAWRNMELVRASMISFVRHNGPIVMVGRMALYVPYKYDFTQRGQSVYAEWKKKKNISDQLIFTRSLMKVFRAKY